MQRLKEFNSFQGLTRWEEIEMGLKPIKEFFDVASPKDIFQAKLNSMKEKSNSENSMGVKGTHRRILVVDRRR